MYYFCTLFDQRYLSRGLALYHSLNKHLKGDFHLFVVAFDALTLQVLQQHPIDHLTVIALSDFEDDLLKKIKPTRSAGEYCWTCTPSIIRYVLLTYQLPHCTYLDADVYFFNSPASYIAAQHAFDVSITPHRYTPEYDKTDSVGTYCVQFLTFYRTQNALNILNWWRNACIEWCYDRFEAGRFGDQKYLEDWPRRFEGVYVIEDFGVGAAPWNIQQAQPIQGATTHQLQVGEQHCPLVFYHFHGVRLGPQLGRFDLGEYKLSPWVIKQIYQPYLAELHRIERDLSTHHIQYRYHNEWPTMSYLRSMIKFFLRQWRGNDNRIRLSC